MGITYLLPNFNQHNYGPSPIPNLAKCCHSFRNFTSEKLMSITEAIEDYHNNTCLRWISQSCEVDYFTFATNRAPNSRGFCAYSSTSGLVSGGVLWHWKVVRRRRTSFTKWVTLLDYFIHNPAGPGWLQTGMTTSNNLTLNAVHWNRKHGVTSQRVSPLRLFKCDALPLWWKNVYWANPPGRD